MPSFAFWKSSKTDEVNTTPLGEDVVAQEPNPSIPIRTNLFDLNPGKFDAGVFLFDEADLPPPTPASADLPQVAPGVKLRSEDVSLSSPETIIAAEKMAPELESIVEEPVTNASVTSREASPCPDTSRPQRSSLLSTQDRLASSSSTAFQAELLRGKVEKHSLATKDSSLQSQQICDKRDSPNEPTSMQIPSKVRERFASKPHDRDSGVYLSDEEELSPRSRPTSFALSETSSRSRTSSLTVKHTTPTKLESSPQRASPTTCRLRRPAELNLGSSTLQEGLKPRSELELRYNVIRNSKTQVKAALQSPTQLLKKRLNMTSREEKDDEKTRVFRPPRPTSNGCLLPGPRTQMEAFTSTSVRARTEAGGRPAWWCKFDKLVVFDGVDLGDNGDLKFHTRTSKGLSIARRRGDLETIIIPMDCAHCQEMLNRHEWKYDMQVCKRSVCWGCKERCKWEVEQEMQADKINEEIEAPRAEANRDRADSVLQTEQVRDEVLMRKVGIEQGRPKSPMEAVGGIEERLECAER